MEIFNEMKYITVSEVLKRSNVPPGTGEAKTIGRRVAQCYRAINPGKKIPQVPEGERMVNSYPQFMRFHIIKIAKKYCQQHEKRFVLAKRKRTEKKFVVNS